MYYVYFIKSTKTPGKKYVGYTTNLEERLEKHNTGGSLYTRNYRPWKLIAYVAFDSKEKALSFEKYVLVNVRSKLSYLLKLYVRLQS